MGPMSPGPAPLRRARAALAAGLAGAALAVGAAAVRPAPALAQDALPSVREVMDHIDDLYRAGSSHAVMRMTVVNERGTRELELESWSRGNDEGLVVIRSPAREAGTATLRTDEGLWNYAPRADRLIRIPSGLLSESWMGSHFTNDDLMRETSYLDDYDAGLDRVEGEDGTFLRATLVPRPKAPVVYSRLVFLVRPGDWVPVRAEYWDDGEVVRTMRFEDVRTVAGRPIPMTMVLVPEDAPDERTEVTYLELELDVPVEDGLFTRQGLRRVAR